MMRKQLKKLDKIAQEIISLEDKYSALSDEELANQTNVLKEKLNSGSELDDILVDAFAFAKRSCMASNSFKKLFKKFN